MGIYIKSSRSSISISTWQMLRVFTLNESRLTQSDTFIHRERDTGKIDILMVTVKREPRDSNARTLNKLCLKNQSLWETVIHLSVAAGAATAAVENDFLEIILKSFRNQKIIIISCRLLINRFAWMIFFGSFACYYLILIFEIHSYWLSLSLSLALFLVLLSFISVHFHSYRRINLFSVWMV